MSDFTPFFVDRAKGGRASCKGCKGNCPGGELRLAKVVPSPYGENQQMKSWHHVDCFMNALLKQRPTTKRIDSIDDIGNWHTLSTEDQEFLLKKINDMEKLYAHKNTGKYSAKIIKNESGGHKNSDTSSNEQSDKKSPDKNKKVEPIISDDDKFSQFAKLCKIIAKNDAYTDKTATVNSFFRKGTGDTFQGDLGLWCKLLLPQVSKRVYNLKSKQLVKLFSRIFNVDHDDMLTDLEQGDVANTIKHFFSKSKTVKPASESTLTIHDVDNFLEDLSKLTKEDEQIYHFKKIVKKCTLEDLKMIIRLIKCDLRINAGPKHILEGVHPDAYNVFQTSRDLNMVLDRVLPGSSGVKHKDTHTKKSVDAKLVLMTPVLPMLAEACKSVEMAMKKCPNGMFSEIKYDGERVQVHKKGDEFRYFSRALKPVMPHKVSHFKDYLPKAFPQGTDLVLDAEVLMVDVNTGKPLPFGTLGKHKQSEFKDAQVCLFIFDCLYYNGKVLLDVPIRKRRKILLENMVEVKNHVMLSEQEHIQKPADLAKMIAKVLQLGLEGLVLKDLESTYEPGKRHWLKVKKDYLFDGAMADTADLVVLGAWFGTGKKGGMMSVFLMGCLDKRRNRWVTVTKVHTGHDDSTLERLQKELAPLMVKISGEYSKVPSWLDCNRGMVPDFVAKDPKEQPVWEITGTELTKANIHTADGISVRFPRVTRIRDDKNWESATNLEELKHLYKTSKEKTDVTLLDKLAATASAEEKKDSSKTKIKDIPKEDEQKGSLKKLQVTTLDSFVKKDVKKELNTSTDSNSDRETKSKNKDRSEKKESENTKKRKSEDTNSSSDRVDSNHKKEKYRKTDHKSNENNDIIDNERRSSKKIKKEKRLDSSSESDYKKDKAKKRKTDIFDSDEDKNHDKKNIKNDMNYVTTEKERNKDKTKKSKTSNNDSISPETNKKTKSTIKTETSTKIDLESKIRHESTSSSDTIVDDDIKSSFEDIEYGPELQLLPENPLPDIFLDKRLGFYPDFISFPEDLRDHFERHWIAYGGTVVKAIRSMDVDYVVHNEDVIEFKDMLKLKKKVPQNARHVSKGWLIQCINEVKLCNTEDFPVYVKPKHEE